MVLHHKTQDLVLITTHALIFGEHNKASVVTIHKTLLLPTQYIISVKTIKKTNYLYVPIGLTLNHILNTHSVQPKLKSATKKEFKMLQAPRLYLERLQLITRQMIYALGKYFLQNQN